MIFTYHLQILAHNEQITHNLQKKSALKLNKCLLMKHVNAIDMLAGLTQTKQNNKSFSFFFFLTAPNQFRAKTSK